jgi:hypothetical protein
MPREKPKDKDVFRKYLGLAIVAWALVGFLSGEIMLPAYRNSGPYFFKGTELWASFFALICLGGCVYSDGVDNQGNRILYLLGFFAALGIYAAIKIFMG